MLTLYKYDELYQWDTGRALLITPDSENATPTQIHFEYHGESIIQQPETDGENTIVWIPNICLTESQLLIVYEVIGEWVTVRRYKFHVREKSRPANYVYDEAEILKWTQLEKLATEMAESAAKSAAAAAESELNAENFSADAALCKQSACQYADAAEKAQIAAETAMESAESFAVSASSSKDAAIQAQRNAEKARQDILDMNISASQIEQWDSNGTIYVSDGKPEALTPRDIWLRII